MTGTKANRPAPPEDLDGEALLEWHRVCDELAAADRLDKADRAILILYVENWQTWRAAVRGVNQHGAVIKYSNGTPGVSPFHKVAREQAVLLRGLLTDLGLTPTSRGKNGTAGEASDLDI
jgi:P27 family predicted phage terminase small subunit